MVNRSGIYQSGAVGVRSITELVIKSDLIFVCLPKTIKTKDIFNQEWVSEFFDVHKINNLLDDHYHKIKNNGRKIYTIYAFLIWYKDYFVDNIYLSK